MPLWPSAPDFTTRVPIQFLSVDVPSLNITGASSLVNNPAEYNILTGTFGKIDTALNGLTYYRGDGEFAPFALEMKWNILGINDYLAMASLRPYLVTHISFRNVGYFGKLVMSGPKSAKPSQSDVVSATGMFYPLAPSDAGGATAIARISDPTALTLVGQGANTGYIPVNTVAYYWLTFSTRYGETNFFANSYTFTSDQAAIQIGWTWPASTQCTKVSIYSSLTNDPTTAKLQGEVPNGLPAGWRDYVGPSGAVVNRQPPTASTAYRGQWMAGLWINTV